VVSELPELGVLPLVGRSGPVQNPESWLAGLQQIVSRDAQWTSAGEHPELETWTHNHLLLADVSVPS